MIDALLLTLLAYAKAKAMELGEDFLDRTIQLALDRASGKATDEQIMEWLREAQGGAR